MLTMSVIFRIKGKEAKISFTKQATQGLVDKNQDLVLHKFFERIKKKLEN